VPRRQIKRTMVPHPSEIQNFQVDIENKLFPVQVKNDPENSWKYLLNYQLAQSVNHGLWVTHVGFNST